MQEAKGYYLELMTKNLWSKKGTDGVIYINLTTETDGEECEIENDMAPAIHHEKNTQDTSTCGKDKQH
jgi:hypothetical protein